jgi:hypothetical protein
MCQTNPERRSRTTSSANKSALWRGYDAIVAHWQLLHAYDGSADQSSDAWPVL